MPRHDTMRRIRAAALMLLLAACQVTVPVPEGELNTIAEKITKIGHPGGQYISAAVVGASSGWFNQARYVDISVVYTPALSSEERAMTVRFHVETVSPCHVRTEVLSDTGPKPRLLDNQYAAPRVGQMVCDMLDD